MSTLDAFRIRRIGWPRVIIYLVIIGLALHITIYFIQSIPSASIRSPTKLYFDFPWYTQPHARPKTTHKYTTTHLSAEQRRSLRKTQVALAKDKVTKVFPTLKGIPGSAYAHNEERASKFRQLVNCWTTGEWVKVESPLTMHHFQDPYYGSCERKFRRKNSHENTYREAVQYEWKTQCPMGVVDASKWCQALNGRSMVVVGDLAHYQIHELLLDSLREGPTVCFGELNCKDHTLCTDMEHISRLRYLRNDLLSVKRRVDTGHGTPRTDIIEWPFTASNVLRKYQILILSRAPVQETDDVFTDKLIDTLRVIRKGSPNALIIYKSTSIGHPYCDDATEPLKKPLTEEEERLLPFDWSEVSRRNAIARAIVEGAGGIFVDLAALTDLRPDGHIGGQDCMRYCFPGPLDSWAQILYHVFLGLEDNLPFY